MTDPLRPDDELVSAALDGEATEAERARVAADPALAARARELAAVRDLVAGDVPPPDPERREAAVAAALAARPAADAPVAATPAPEGRVLAFVRDPAQRRFLAVAAGVLLVLVGAGVLADRLDGAGSGDDAGSVALDAPTAGDGAEGADEAAGAATVGPTFDLGPVADEAGLEAALAEAGVVARSGDDVATAPSTLAESEGAAPTTTAAPPVPGDGTDCQVRLEEADPSRAGVLAVGTATYAGTPAVVYVFGTVDGGRQVVAVDAGTCAVLTVR